MTHLYKVHFHKNDYSIKPHEYLFRENRRMCAEDILIQFKLEFPERMPLAVQEDGKFIWSVKDELKCSYCGGVDAHLPRCRGGYGL